MKHLYFWSLITFWTCASIGYSQSIFSEEDIQFERISSGISQNTVTTILQDKYGFLWVGTRNGLNRFDGVKFKVYERSISNPRSLGHGYVSTIYEDSRGDLWIGTNEGGLSLYNWDTDDFTHFRNEVGDPSSISGNSVTTIYEDSEGNFWVGTEYNGLNLFNREERTFKRYLHEALDQESLSHNEVIEIFQDRLGRLWVATRFNGLNLFDNESGTFKRYNSDPKVATTLSDDDIRAVYKSQDENIWIGTTHGLNLMYLDRSGEVSFKRFLHDDYNENTIIHNTVSAISEDDYGNLWFGTENGGLSIYNPETTRFKHYVYDARNPTGLPSNSIWYIYKDHDGTMWLGPLHSGLSKVERSSSRFVSVRSNPSISNSLSHNSVTSILEDSRGDFWIGTDGGGLNHYDVVQRKFTHYRHDPFNPSSIGSDAVLIIYEDTKSRIWVGTWGGGLNLMNKETGTFHRYTKDPSDENSISSNNIFTVLEDSRGFFWVGGYLGALDMFDPEEGTFSHFYGEGMNPHSLNEIERLLEDDDRNLWIATRGGGLHKMIWKKSGDRELIQYLPNDNDPNSISSNIIISILQDSRGYIWTGSEGGGVSRFDPVSGEFKNFTKENGLPNDVVHGILEDNDGNLWFSTNRGISRFDLDANTFRNYDVSDGLQSNEFIRGSSLKTKSGNLIFGGINGFNIFNPRKAQDNEKLPTVYITDFSVHGERILPIDGAPVDRAIIESDKIDLTHDQSVFQFEFVAISYKKAMKNEYAYMLEGYDQDWQSVGNQRFASYTRVPPGNYTFKVRASNNDGKWNINGAQLKIFISPPWWQTWWAYSLYSIALLALLYWSRKSIVNRERLKSNLKLEHMELVKMQEMDQLKSRFFANISHEFRTPLSLILGPLRSIYNGSYEGDPKKQFKIMMRNGQRLLQLINQLLDLSKVESGKMTLRVMRVDLVDFLRPIFGSFASHAQRQHLQYMVHIETKGHIIAYIDKDKIEKIVLNLLSNAFKFTPEFGSIDVYIRDHSTSSSCTDGCVEIAIKDTGIGIPSDQLDLIFNRFYQVDGNHDDKRKGTGIGLSLTKELTELHGGAITVKSIEGKGTEFIVKIPVLGDHLNDAEIVDGALEEELSEDSVSLIDDIIEEDYSPERSMEVNSKIESLKSVLIIEDNEDVRAYLSDQLEINYKILEADNGTEGFDLATEELPDLIISDVMMPGLNGYELCKKVKTDERTCHIPVILLTAKADSEDKITGFEAGADYYVTKPFNSNILELRIRNILKSRDLVKDHYQGASVSLEPKNIKLTSPDEIFLKRILECVEDHMSNSEFSVEDLGRELGMSRMQLYRKMKALTGQSANEFIRTIRLKRAAQLIEQNHFTIAEVTYEVGFNDLQYFRDCFKKQFGVNPSKFPLNTD